MQLPQMVGLLCKMRWLGLADRLPPPPPTRSRAQLQTAAEPSEISELCKTWDDMMRSHAERA